MIWAYYALLSLNAKKQHSLLHPSTWSAMWFTARGGTGSADLQMVRRFPGIQSLRRTSRNGHVINGHQGHAMSFSVQGTDGQARTQHVPVSKRTKTLWQQNDGWHRLYYFDLLWGSNVLRCLTWVVAISCQFPDCWSSKEIASWMLTPITTISDTQAGKTCLTVTQIRLWMIISKGKLSYWSIWTSYIILWFCYGWKCLKNTSIDIQNNHHRYTRFQLRVLLWLGDARTRHCKPGFKNWDMQWEHGTSMSMWQGFPILPLLPHVENSIWDCVATNPKSAQNSANLISWFKMSQCVCVCVKLC